MVAVSRPGANVSIRRPHRQTRRRSATTTWSWLAFALGLLVFVASPRMGMYLRAGDDPSPADAAFVSHDLNVQRAVLDGALVGVRGGTAPHVVIGQLPAERSDSSIVPPPGELAKRYLMAGGAAEEAVQVLTASGDEDEARALGEAAASRGWKRVVAYVPEVRSRRLAGALARNLAATNADLMVVPVPDPNVHLDRWWETRAGVTAVLAEYPRLLLSYVRHRPLPGR